MTNPDAQLIVLGASFRRLAAEWIQVTNASDADIPEDDPLGGRIHRLARRIVRMRATTDEGRFVKAEVWAHYDSPPRTGCIADIALRSLMNDILGKDAERILGQHVLPSRSRKAPS